MHVYSSYSGNLYNIILYHIIYICIIYRLFYKISEIVERVIATQAVVTSLQYHLQHYHHRNVLHIFIHSVSEQNMLDSSQRQHLTQKKSGELS